MTKEILYDNYIVNNLTLKECSEKLQVPYGTFVKLLKLFGIKKSKELHYENVKKTVKKKYNVNSVSELTEVKDKKKQTCLKNYGVENPSQNESIKSRKRETMKNHYGSLKKAYDNVRDKTFKTLIDKYGSLEEGYAKQKETRSTTCMRKYGYDNVLQVESIRNKLNLSLNSEKAREKRRATCLKKYNVEYYSQTSEYLEKQDITKRKNNSYKSSKDEENMYIFLKDLFEIDDVVRWYSSKKYPFKCDFYIKSIDLYIELNLSWTHGKMPYDENNEECIKQLNEWKEKAKTSKYYVNAIDTWTRRDVLKIKTAKENNLNYIMLYTKDDVKSFIALLTINRV